VWRSVGGWFRRLVGSARHPGETILKPFLPAREDSVKRLLATVQLASVEVEIWRSPMTALVQALSRVSRAEIQLDPLTAIALFCGAGLLVSLICMSYGLDLSAGFF
jgi:hypothetical protein